MARLIATSFATLIGQSIDRMRACSCAMHHHHPCIFLDQVPHTAPLNAAVIINTPI